MQLVIGIDIGTTNCKAVIINTAGGILREVRVGYENEDSAAATEQNAAIVLKAVMVVLKKAIALCQSEGQLCAISFSAAMHSILMVDESGNALTPAITWADSRSEGQARRLSAKPESAVIYKNTGTPIHPMSPLCKIIWWKEMEPALFNGAHKFISLKEYVWFKLFGTFEVDHSIASATGLFDIFSLSWCPEAMEQAGLQPHQLSTPVSTLHKVFLQNEALCSDLNINTTIPFYIGGSDGCMANLGTGVLNAASAAITIGTSGAVRTTVSALLHDKGHRLFNYILTDDLFITGGPINNGGIILQWFGRTFLKGSLKNESGFDWVDAMASRVSAGAERLIFLPYLLGERAPIWNANARGVFFGLSAKHTDDHMLRAVLEGISYSLKDVMMAIEALYGPIDTVYASGGFIQSKCWVQILSDVLGKKIRISNKEDASALGAAYLALYAEKCIDELNDVKAFSNPMEEVIPDMGQHLIYQQYFELYRQIYTSVKNLYEPLHALPQ